MSHPDFEAQLDAYLDGELAAADARELEAHVAQCPECFRFRDGRMTLRAALHADVPAFSTPQDLRQRVSSAIRQASQRSSGPTLRAPAVWRWAAIAASLTLVAFGGWRLGVRYGAGGAIGEEVLASHVRSLMPGHLTDVLSSDQHTVKPWFNGRLDFSPPVYDFAGRGYPLLGGRLDYVHRQAVAALVYGRRQHLINLFVWPAARGPAGAATSETLQGYHLLHWSNADDSYWLVSDLGLAELSDFARLVQRADSAAGPPVR
jgi:anti-sigma factor (TIGR02949 family)